MINLSIPMDRSSTHNKEQFGGCLIKITYILKILKGLNEMLQISTIFKFINFLVHFANKYSVFQSYS